MGKRLLVCSTIICIVSAAIASEGSAFQRQGRPNRGQEPIELVSGVEGFIHKSGSREYWSLFPVREIDGDWTSTLRIHSDPALLRDLGRIGVFKFTKDDPTSSLIVSGDVVRISTVGSAVIADPAYDANYIRIDSRFLLSSSNPDARFIIEKIAGSWNLRLRSYDEFILRSANQKAWLWGPCELPQGRVCMTTKREEATSWAFVTSPPTVVTGVGAPPPTGWPPANPGGDTTSRSGTPAGSTTGSSGGGPYTCYGDRDLNFAGCKGRYGYVCNNSGQSRTVKVSYDDASGDRIVSLSETVSVPANASIGNGAAQLPGGSNFAPNAFGGNSVCRPRNWVITGMN